MLLPYPLREAYDYRLPDGMDVEIGDYVRVPLGSREVLGVVWGEAHGRVDPGKLKAITHRYDMPPMPEVQRRFVEWVAHYTLTPPGMVLQLGLRAPAALEPPRPTLGYALSGQLPPELKMTEARRRVIAILGDGPPRPAGELAREAGCGLGVIRGLADAGVLEPVMMQPALPQRPDWQQPGPALSPDQALAAADLAAKVRSRQYSATLLDGVTGAGKTEVYFEAVAAALEQGRQVLLLLPEIALSAQFLDRFVLRFGASAAVWHSDVGVAQRRDTWRGVATGTVPVIVGARSALFLPYADLGLIVVDEEHDSAFKQEDGVIYHARDMAVVRAHLAEIPIVLVSATPSLETVVNADTGRYSRLHLPARHAGASLPRIEAIDLRLDQPPRRRWLSGKLERAISETLEAGEQVMLFLNRRGYAPLTLCRACGFRLQCPNCTAWLVEHRLAGRLQCHHCGHAAPLPPECPNCGTPGMFAPVGPGVERIAEEVDDLFPGIRRTILTSDTLAGPLALQETIRRIRDHEIDLVIGTQVVAKGHHFPMLTLVGVVDADLGLTGGDLRASERTYQLLHQVAGRAGRMERPGTVYLQTHMPDHPVMQALVSDSRDAFLEAEKQERLEAGMPPFGRLAALIVSGPDAEAVDNVSRALARTAPRDGDVLVLGPAPAPLALLRGRHRRRLLLKAAKQVAVQGLIAAWLEQVAAPASVRIQVDIDPYSFM